MALSDFAQFSFSSGELAPELHGNVTLEQHDTGLAKASNFVVNYLGGAFVRPGLRFIDYIQWNGKPVRLVPFRFNRDAGNNVTIIFTENRIRFVQDGNYIVSAPVAIEALGQTITITGHSFTDEDWVEIDNEIYAIDNATADTFTLKTPFDAPVTLTAATEIYPIYTLSHSYAVEDFFDLKFDQLRDEIYINHINYPEQKLIRSGTVNWALTETNFEGYNAALSTRPTTSAGTGGGADPSAALFAVVPVNEAGQEGPLTFFSMQLERNTNNYSANLGYVDIVWAPVPGAAFYKLYRSLITPDADTATYGQDLGFIGNSVARRFTDSNITPDFTQTPLQYYNPFAGGQLTNFTVGASGNGYSREGSTIVVNDPTGSGAQLLPLVQSNGAVIGVRVLDRGEGYTNPTLTVTSGNSAVITAEATPLDGNNPSCGAMVQQRRVRAGTFNFPNSMWGSRPGEPDSYYRTQLEFATDPFELSVEASELTPIRHIAPAPDGMFVFYDSGVDLVRGVDDSIITPGSAKRTPQTAQGCSRVVPLKIEQEILYVTSDFDGVEAIGRSNLPTYFTNRERTLLSSHLFTNNNAIVDWTWAKSPDRIIWAVREDGSLLSGTYVASQNVAAWCRHTTKGLFKSVAAVREGNRDLVYGAVQRNVNGKAMMFLECFDNLRADTVENMFGVDSGISLALNYPASNVTFAAYEGQSVAVFASEEIFTVANVGDEIRALRGRGEVIEFIDAQNITIRIDVPLVQEVEELSIPPIVAEGAWTLDTPVLTVGGLAHLEGEFVDILVNGAEDPQKQVINGQITLTAPGSNISIGLPYQGTLKTLPLAIASESLEATLKASSKLAVRLLDSMGLEFGDASGDTTYPIPPKNNETFGVAPDFLSGVHNITIRTFYDYDGSITVKKNGPFTGGVLGLVREANLGNK